MAKLFLDNLFLVYFIYGLAFFLMGWSILIRVPGRINPFTRALTMIALFGLVHGVVEWLDMYLKVDGNRFSEGGLAVFLALRLLLLSLSFQCLLRAGIQLANPRRMHLVRWGMAIWLSTVALLAVVDGVWRPGFRQWGAFLTGADILSRYCLATPAILLTGLGLWKSIAFLRKHYDIRIVRRAHGALACFALYGLLAGVITPAGRIGLSPYLNQDAFLALVQVPVQVFRALTAIGIMYFLIRIMGIFQQDELNRDVKTGLYTTPMIYRFISGHVQQQRTLSVLFIDIDHFKRVNDRFGHLVGDGVLRGMAELFQTALRSIDLVGRFGGEEFVVVLPDEDHAAAAAVAERLRAALEMKPFPFAGLPEPLHVTVSIGVAQWQQGLSIEQLLARADEAMYQAKASGRNQVIDAEAKSAQPVHELVSLRWNDRWNSGLAEIDAQHRQLLELGNALISQSLDGAGRDAIISRLEVIVAHVAEHFAYEERVLEQFLYPDTEKHAAVHRTIEREALAFLERARTQTLQSKEYFSFIVNEVIIGHLLKDDVQYFPYTRGADAVRLPAVPAVEPN